MTKRYDWQGIRERYESGETAGAISRSLHGRPTRQGIQKRAKREGWLQISVSAKDAARKLPSIQKTFVRAQGEDLGQRSEQNAQIMLSAFERGASPKIAAGLVGLTESQLKQWMIYDRQVAMEIRARVAQVAAENIDKIRDAGDWRASKWILDNTPFSREEFGSRKEEDGPVIVLNIKRT